jgi:hypothetical protein
MRKAKKSLLQRVELYTYRDHGLILGINEGEDIDEALKYLIREAYV